MNSERIEMYAKFTLFSPEKPFNNLIGIVIFTILFYFIGVCLRIVDQFSLFWPLNAVLAAIFVRNPYLNHWLYYLACYLAMIIYDSLTAQWGWQSIIINFSNLVFIILVSRFLLHYSRNRNGNHWVGNALNIFHFCLIASIVCALVGAFGYIGLAKDYSRFLPLYANWVSEQFSTGVLLIPCLVTARWPNWKKMRLFTPTMLYPAAGIIVALIASVVIGGAGSLALPLPALIWCAIRYPLPLTALITLITGVTEIVLIAKSIIDIHIAQPLLVDQMFSARLGVATIAVCPLIVSISVNAINKLIKQISLRADFDYLTGVYSRSGLFEFLKNSPQNRAIRAKSTLCIMLLDIDFFKHINDSYGHECGDKVLASFAARVKQVVGERGVIARMGGEEFSVVCITEVKQQGYKIAEQIRKTIELNTFHYLQHTLRITVSIGLVTTTSTKLPLTHIFDTLIREADKNLYISKHNGRNQTNISHYAEHMTAAKVE